MADGFCGAQKPCRQQYFTLKQVKLIHVHENIVVVMKQLCTIVRSKEHNSSNCRVIFLRHSIHLYMSNTNVLLHMIPSDDHLEILHAYDDHCRYASKRFFSYVSTALITNATKGRGQQDENINIHC